MYQIGNSTIRGFEINGGPSEPHIWNSCDESNYNTLIGSFRRISVGAWIPESLAEGSLTVKDAVFHINLSLDDVQMTNGDVVDSTWMNCKFDGNKMRNVKFLSGIFSGNKFIDSTFVNGFYISYSYNPMNYIYDSTWVNSKWEGGKWWNPETHSYENGSPPFDIDTFTENQELMRKLVPQDLDPRLLMDDDNTRQSQYDTLQPNTIEPNITDTESMSRMFDTIKDRRSFEKYFNSTDADVRYYAVYGYMENGGKIDTLLIEHPNMIYDDDINVQILLFKYIGQQGDINYLVTALQNETNRYILSVITYYLKRRNADIDWNLTDEEKQRLAEFGIYSPSDRVRDKVASIFDINEYSIRALRTFNREVKLGCLKAIEKGLESNPSMGTDMVKAHVKAAIKQFDNIKIKRSNDHLRRLVAVSADIINKKGEQTSIERIARHIVMANNNMGKIELFDKVIKYVSQSKRIAINKLDTRDLGIIYRAVNGDNVLKLALKE